MEYNFGKILREIRNDKEIGQADLGRILNVANNTISSWERGNSQPTIEQLRAIAIFFNINGNYLLGLEK
ncbi:MAG: helix-turn-helix domain-containing protein [Firmicutes bacterium]|nr:helix-turn-helix domain-containing protein [Bacillota bacterium]